MAVPLAKLGEVAAGSSSKAELNVVLFIDPRFGKNLEGSVKKSMDRSGTLWARGMRRDMGASGTDGRRSRPGKAPAIQSTALAMSIGHKHDKPNSGRTKFKMYVGSVGRQSLRRAPKEKTRSLGETKKSNFDKLKSMIRKAKRAIGRFGRLSKRRRGGGKAAGAAMTQRALPHEYGYWLEYGKNKTAPGGTSFNVPFEARPWAGPGSATHGLWVEGRYFLQDFREGMQKHLRKYLR